MGTKLALLRRPRECRDMGEPAYSHLFSCGQHDRRQDFTSSVGSTVNLWGRLGAKSNGPVGIEASGIRSGIHAYTH
ncbi:unnamed protein product [Protopolystoma xenopodis]|uniref:Uncharacterized protein n=1 Tax=Protopolystoma xenopodis TaxID=117903 RepID=A0A3S5AVU5_9PLAT|nr:unnamed protein product [Protopolystoma xenopodis]